MTLSPITDPRSLKDFIVQLLEDKKAEDLVVIDLENKTNIADFLIIASGTSIRHLVTMAEFIAQELKTVKRLASIEGANSASWILLDASEVIVHLFRPEARMFYNLEKMWSAPLPKQEEH